jgi:hypothetical protein
MQLVVLEMVYLKLQKKFQKQLVQKYGQLVLMQIKRKLFLLNLHLIFSHQ